VYEDRKRDTTRVQEKKIDKVLAIYTYGFDSERYDELEITTSKIATSKITAITSPATIITAKATYHHEQTK
jgi:hypothetical protein